MCACVRMYVCMYVHMYVGDVCMCCVCLYNYRFVCVCLFGRCIYDVCVGEE